MGTGTQNPLGRNQVLNNIEQSRQDKEARKNQINPDLSPDFRSSDGNLFTSRPANSRGVVGIIQGEVAGGQPPDNNDPPRNLQSGQGGAIAVQGNALSIPALSPYPSDTLRGLNKYQMSTFSGKERAYEVWRLPFQKSYGSRLISAKEKVLYLLVYWKESLTLCVLDL